MYVKRNAPQSNNQLTTSERSYVEMRRRNSIAIGFCLSLTILLMCSAEKVAAQSGYPHHPLCNNQHTQTTATICYSYATSRAFGRGWNDTRCPANKFNAVQSMIEEYFERDGFILSNVRQGDIIGFGSSQSQPDHVCYVEYLTGQPVTSTDHVHIAQVDGPTSISDFTGTLTNVINGAQGVTAQGYPTSIWRKRPLWSIKLQNSFTGGKVGIDDGQSVEEEGEGSPPTEYDSPHPVSNLHWESSVIGVAVMDGRLHDGYVRRFWKWSSPYSEAFTVSVSHQVRALSYTSTTEFTANLDREFNVTFQNSLPGATGGQIKVNQVTYSVPHATTVTDSFPEVTADAIYNAINRIEYTFAQWNDASTVNPRVFTVLDNNTTYTASYNAKPLPPANVTAGGPVGANVCVSWQIHPHDSVTQYQIWRQVKHQHQGTIGPPQLLTTVPRTTTQYIDYDYVVTEGYTHDLVWYDVRSYFSLNQTYSDPNWVAIFAQIAPKIATPPFVPTVWTLGNSPNPFNPSTRIVYSLVEDGGMSLTIYDIQGREVASLDKSYREAGYYSATWDGRNAQGSPVGSGVYFARLNVTGASGKVLYSHTIKLLLAK
ncbi:T9SS type A sorting domain-containing protein [Sphingobacteriales bacterium CHB3]|nr:T9SS type A sorting domain-containing protein [Sphingobacteriales bacterium CHB3]